MLICTNFRMLKILILLPVLSYSPAIAQVSDILTDIPFISRIVINNDSVIYSTDKAGSREEDLIRNGFILGSMYNDILFELQPAMIYEYQYLLSGFDKKYTPWKKGNYKEYTNLPAGRYFFNYRFRSESGIAGEKGPFSIRVLPAWYFSKLAIISYLILFMLILWALYEYLILRFAKKQYVLEQIINKRTEDLIIEKEKTEALLSNILPKDTADELITTGKATKIKYSFVTVLFSDIQGFTQIAEEMNPEVLIDELDKFFFHFDSVVGKYRIEKIKTIGDAYMCAGGIPEKNRTNPVEVILAAIEMQQYMNRLKESALSQGIKFWDIRIGIHTGPVVAGVVGHKKLSYDIWGDTVNTASRMESSGEAGKINISGTTYEFVKDFFVCEYRGKMPVKYKGEIDMYFVKEIAPGLRDENGSPNKDFMLKMSMLKLHDLEDIVITMFEEEAPPNLYFHNASFVKDVCSHVDLLSRSENLPDEEFIDLRIASIFLFAGYISDYMKPLETALNLIEKILPQFYFNDNNINKAKIIINNSFNERYETISDNILHDARYAYLGRVDYLKLTDKLLRENKEHDMGTDNETWIAVQKKLLEEHDFKTTAGRLLRTVSIENQIAILQVYKK